MQITIVHYTLKTIWAQNSLKITYLPQPGVVYGQCVRWNCMEIVGDLKVFTKKWDLYLNTEFFGKQNVQLPIIRLN